MARDVRVCEPARRDEVDFGFPAGVASLVMAMLAGELATTLTKPATGE